MNVDTLHCGAVAFPTYAAARAEAQRLVRRHSAWALHAGGIADAARSVWSGPDGARNRGTDGQRVVRKARKEAVGQAHLSQAARDVLAARQRRISAPGWTPWQEVGPGDCELMLEVAVSYLLKSLGDGAAQIGAALWPEGWSLSLANPLPPRDDLVRAGAVILAEIERHDHVAEFGANDQTGDRP